MDLFQTQSAREVFLPEPTIRESARKAIAISIRRRWRMTLICLGASVLIGAVYLLFAPKVLTTSCTIRIDGSNADRSAADLALGGLVAEQTDAIRSTPVIALAVSSPSVRGLSLWSGKKSRIEFVKSNLAIHALAEPNVYEITLMSTRPADAEKVLDALVASYIQYTKSPDGAAPSNDLRDLRQKVEGDLATTRNELDSTVKQLNDAAPTPESRQRLAASRAELTALLAQSGNPTSRELLKARLDSIIRQSEQNDSLDDRITQSQAEIDRLTALRDDLAGRLNLWHQAGVGAVSVSVVKSAATDPDPVAPRPLQTIAWCMLLGALLGCLMAITVDMTRDRLHDDADAAALCRTAVMGHLPEMAGDLSTPVLRGQCVLVKPSDPAAGTLRNVCTVLEEQLVPGIDKTILVTGPGTNNGKSTLACNLAIAMARDGKRVVLVDAHHHRPMVYKVFSIEDYVGLNSAIDGSLKLDDVLHVTGLLGLEVLPTGSLVDDWTDLLNRPEFLDVLTELSERFDRVIIDGGPAHLDETRIISAFCDATIIALDARRCQRRELKSAVKGLRAVGAKLTGVVLADLPSHRVEARVATVVTPAPRSRIEATSAGQLVKSA